MNKPSHIPIESFDYDLPPERIAKYPLEKRDASKLLIYQRGSINSAQFSDVPDVLTADDQVIFNTTRVVQARLQFYKKTGSRIEVFCLEPIVPSDFQLAFGTYEKVEFLCLVGNAKKWKSGTLELDFGRGTLFAEMKERTQDKFVIGFSWSNPDLTFAEVLGLAGSTPIPPYLKREPEVSDATTYQTVYARDDGSVAAPTAGLHFTADVMSSLDQKGVSFGELVLHVGAGTFIPVKEKNATAHAMHAETVSIRPEILRSHGKKKRTIAVGTTTTRSLESIYWLGVKVIAGREIDVENLLLDQWEAYDLPGDIPVDESFEALCSLAEESGFKEITFRTRLMIVPGYRFKVINGIFTNFHQPKSTLLLLIAAAAGDDWRRIYKYALENDYRFLSYGDSSLIMID